MKTALVPSKVDYCFFDKTFKDSSNIYLRSKYNNNQAVLEQVEKNRKAVASVFGLDDLITLKQVHGNKVVLVSKAELKQPEIEADALLTTDPNLIIGILTADCVPVLLASIDGKVIGAAHCGWRSAKADIITNLVAKMRQAGASELTAIIGPSIRQASYEVSADYYDDFISESKANDLFFTRAPKEGHYLFNLPAYVRAKLVKEGVHVSSEVIEDTYTNPDKYVSRRYLDHNKKEYNQNILSAIAIIK